MGIEIERKFLLKNDFWRKQADSGEVYSQGYLTPTGTKSSVRIRLTGQRAWINVKSATLGISRSEYEYEIPMKDAKELLADLCLKPLIEKRRFKIKSENHVWEIDEFYGENAGLVVAEIELASEEEQFAKPKWLGKEVSDDKRYYNICLVDHPFCDWTDKQDEL